jgi:F-type H+-transporting ATPase subunit gamma
MIAMDNASENADNMLGELEKQYNYLRQSSITKELVEIISGAQALEG